MDSYCPALYNENDDSVAFLHVFSIYTPTCFISYDTLPTSWTATAVNQATWFLTVNLTYFLLILLSGSACCKWSLNPSIYGKWHEDSYLVYFLLPQVYFSIEHSPTLWLSYKTLFNLDLRYLASLLVWPWSLLWINVAVSSLPEVDPWYWLFPNIHSQNTGRVELTKKFASAMLRPKLDHQFLDLLRSSYSQGRGKSGLSSRDEITGRIFLRQVLNITCLWA